MRGKTGARHVWLDSGLVAVERARIAPDDRGLMLGDGLFETIRSDGGALAFLEAHLTRLRSGARALGIPFQADSAAIAAAAGAVLAADGLDVVGARAAVRITLTRGPGARGLLPPNVPAPTLLITAAQLEPQASGPARLIVARERRLSDSTQARFKTLSNLGNVMARRQAAAAGADEALVLNEHGRIAGASAANIFAMVESVLLTPPTAEGALPGVTRGAVIEAAESLGINVDERPLATDDLATRASLAFLTNSLIGLRRVESLEGQEIELGFKRGVAASLSMCGEASSALEFVDGRGLFVALRTRYEEIQAASCTLGDTRAMS